MDQAGGAPSKPALHGDTQRILSRERERRAQHRPHDALAQWRLDAAKALHTSRQRAHYKDHIGVAEREHMSAYDCFDGASVRGGRNPTVPAGAGAKGDAAEADLLTIHPEVDGRLRDASRS
jgi:5'-nucleotidase